MHCVSQHVCIRLCRRSILTVAPVAYLETDLMSGGTRMQMNVNAFYYTHVAGAISELRRALATPGYMSIASIMRTVLNLGWAAVSAVSLLHQEILLIPSAAHGRRPSKR